MEERMEKNFWYLFVAYSTIWTALCVYMIYLSQKNKELQAELRDLRSQLERVLTK
jgi:CcmD family protein